MDILKIYKDLQGSSNGYTKVYKGSTKIYKDPTGYTWIQLRYTKIHMDPPKIHMDLTGSNRLYNPLGSNKDPSNNPPNTAI